jgi:hypothetical protein
VCAVNFLRFALPHCMDDLSAGLVRADAQIAQDLRSNTFGLPEQREEQMLGPT